MLINIMEKVWSTQNEVIITSSENENIVSLSSVTTFKCDGCTEAENTLQTTKTPVFGAYLAGLIEADGSIAVHGEESKSQKYRPKIIVVFSLADKPLAERLAFLTKSGKVYVKSSAGCVLWQIQKKEDVLNIINLINGYMRTPKIEALHRAINWFNKFDNQNIDCLELDLSSIDSNS
jgi:hypothetical protein